MGTKWTVRRALALVAASGALALAVVVVLPGSDAGAAVPAAEPGLADVVVQQVDPCPDNLFPIGPQRPDDCVPCPPGDYRNSELQPVMTRAEACNPADAGYFVAEEGSVLADMKPCPVGSYQPKTGKPSCILASVGHSVAKEASIAQTPCAAGTFQPAEGKASCTPASPGSYVASDAASAQLKCKPGTYQPGSGKTSCIAASVGYYVPNEGSTSQLACPGATTTGSITCPTSSAPTTPPETEEPEDDEEAVVGDLCPPGSWSPNGAIPPGGSCTPAAPGSFVGEAGATEETPCEPGSYSSLFGATSCTPASAGSFVPTAGATSQLPCPAATEPGAATCDEAVLASEDGGSGSGLLRPVLVALAALLVVAGTFAVLRQRGLLGGRRPLPASPGFDVWADDDEPDLTVRRREDWDAPSRPEPPARRDEPPRPEPPRTERYDDLFDDL